MRYNKVAALRQDEAHLDDSFPTSSIQPISIEPGESGKRPAPFAGVLGGLQKRAFDVVLASLMLAFLAPVFVVLALVIKFEDRGPVFYRQGRIGYGGTEFKCMKFRSMAVDADAQLKTYLEKNPQAKEEWERSRKLKSDPRITRAGAFLRKSSLDELPQLFNVLKGEMSLVGPRPVVREELTRYGRAKRHYLRTRPGITGLWQVSGRSDTAYDRRVLLDAAYVTRWSLACDIRILLCTIPVVLFVKGAY